MKFDEVLKGQPCDPIEYLYRENFITLSSIGSIFTFALISNFREHLFDKLMAYVLPIESFQFMKVTLPDIGISPLPEIADPINPTTNLPPNQNPTLNPNANTIFFGNFVRETIIWVFMILLLYILAIFVRWPQSGGIGFNTIK